MPKRLGRLEQTSSKTLKQREVGIGGRRATDRLKIFKGHQFTHLCQLAKVKLW
jgi:hypothetical protein